MCLKHGQVCFAIGHLGRDIYLPSHHLSWQQTATNNGAVREAYIPDGVPKGKNVLRRQNFAATSSTSGRCSQSWVRTARAELAALGS